MTSVGNVGVDAGKSNALTNLAKKAAASGLTYRQYLQSVADNMGGTMNREARAILAVTSDDGIVNPAFVSDPYKYTGKDTGRIDIDGMGYGPEGTQRINGEYLSAYNAARANTNSNSTSYAAAPKKDNSAARNATQKAIDSLADEFSVGNQNIEDDATSLLSKYDKEKNQTETDYNENTTTNNLNLQKNKQNALVAAAQGRRGLRGTLSSLGALSGTGEVLADRAVQKGANDDLAGAADTFAGNAQTLDKAKSNFDSEDEDRRKELETEKANNRTALEGSIASKKQTLFQKMAELFADEDNNAGAAEFLGKAGDLNPEIAKKTRVLATPFTKRTAAFTPGTLADYLAGAGDMTVSARGGGNNPAGSSFGSTLLFGRKKEEQKQ